MGKVSSDRIKINNSIGENINPATEETLAGLSDLFLPKHDYIAYSEPETTEELYTYKLGGSSGDIVLTIEIVYTDATKSKIESITKNYV